MMIDALKDVDVQKIITEGALIYESVKDLYEPGHNGEFLAIDSKSKDVFLGSSSAEAVQSAKEKYPNNMFYVVKVGSDVMETISHLFHNQK